MSDLKSRNLTLRHHPNSQVATTFKLVIGKLAFEMNYWQVFVFCGAVRTKMCFMYSYFIWKWVLLSKYRMFCILAKNTFALAINYLCQHFSLVVFYRILEEWLWHFYCIWVFEDWENHSEHLHGPCWQFMKRARGSTIQM